MSMSLAYEQEKCQQDTSSPTIQHITLQDNIDSEEEKRLLRKLDLALLPLFALLYATNFIDRTAVGGMMHFSAPGCRMNLFLLHR